MIVAEAAILGAIGQALGLIAGLALSIVLVDCHQRPELRLVDPVSRAVPVPAAVDAGADRGDRARRRDSGAARGAHVSDGADRRCVGIRRALALPRCARCVGAQTPWLGVVVARCSARRAGSRRRTSGNEWPIITPDRAIALPADHVSHPDYKIEWWYYTGNLDTREGRRFGYQLTFFRVGVNRTPPNASRWAVRDLHMAHFAVSDLASSRFHVFDRLQREGAGWAGAATDRYAVWNGTWSVRANPDGSHHLQARDRERRCSREVDARSDADEHITLDGARARWLQPQRPRDRQRIGVLLAAAARHARHACRLMAAATR